MAVKTAFRLLRHQGSSGMILGQPLSRREMPKFMLCPDDSRTKLLGENVDDLTSWMSQDNQTDPEILYWVPKYILMRGDRPLSTMGFMSPQFRPYLNALLRHTVLPPCQVK